MKKPSLQKAKIVKNHDFNHIPGASEAFMEALNSGLLNRDIGAGDIGINAKFTLKKYEFNYGTDGFSCTGTKPWISIFRLNGGINNTDVFYQDGSEKSEDYDDISPSMILDLPFEHSIARKIIETHYLGKTLRVIARSAKNSDSYGGRYYIFAVD